MADQVQPEWLCKLPFDVLNLIAEKNRDALTGLTTFRSVCRTWHAAVAPAPRLLPPYPQNAAALVFPLSHGWSMVVDPRDLSCHLSHLATCNTAALPKLNDLGDGSDTSRITHLLYERDSDSDAELPFNRLVAPLDVEDVGDPDDQSTDQEAYSLDEDDECKDQNEYSSEEDDECENQNEYSLDKDDECEDQKEYSSDECEDQNEYSLDKDDECESQKEYSSDEYEDQNEYSLDEDDECEDQNEYSSEEDDECEDQNEYSSDECENPYEYLADAELPCFGDQHLTDHEVHEDRQHKVMTYSHDGRECYSTYNTFSNHFRFAIHVPPSTPAGCTEGVVIMMYHKWLQARSSATGMVFCRPGDASWTMINNPNPKGRNFVDFAYFDGKIFAMNNRCITLVFDPTTLGVLYQVDVPPATANFSSKMSCGVGGAVWADKSRINQSLHFVALPHKLLLVKVFMPESDNYYRPVDFHVFELRRQDPSVNGPAWCKVEDVGGNYELFMDSYHATFSNSGDGRGTRIYHIDNEGFGFANCVWGFCYSIQDNKIVPICKPAKGDRDKYSTKPSWFVP